MTSPARSGPDPSGFAAVILAGGASRRFGSDKALFELGGETLLARVARTLAAGAPRLLVAPPDRYALPGWRNVPDRRPGEGPLAGLESALPEVPGWAALAAVDLPALEAELWARLRAVADGAEIVCPLDAEGRLQPLSALYHADLLGRVSALLDAGERRLKAVYAHARVRHVPWADLADLGDGLFENLNTPPGA